MKTSRAQAQKKRHVRIRRKISGTPERPRLCVHKSSKHIYAQLVDDAAGRTLIAATTNRKECKAEAKSFCNVAWAKRLGAELAVKAVGAGHAAVVFDRGGARYHGVVKAFAEAAREGGLKF